MQKENEHNGWSNHTTWNLNLWLSNNEPTYHFVNKCESLRAFKFRVRHVLNDGISITDKIPRSEINWPELYASFQD